MRQITKQAPTQEPMHQPDHKLGPQDQDMRSVIAIEEGDVDQWLTGTEQEVEQLLCSPAMDVIYLIHA